VLGGDSDPDEASLKEASGLAAGGEYRLDRADLMLAGPERRDLDRRRAGAGTRAGSGPPRPSLRQLDRPRARAVVGGGGRSGAHPTIVRALVLHVLGAPPAALRRIDVRPLSIVRLIERGNQWSLVVGW
jgi:hypothetical protein